MSNVFISYARKNQPIAEVLHSVLIGWGHDVWMDVYRLQPARSWVRDIDDALISSEVVIGLLTPEALDSANVMAEWFWALENERKLILMRAADFSREKVSHRLVHLQWIDYHVDEAAGFGGLRGVVEKGAPLSEAASGSILAAAVQVPEKMARHSWLAPKSRLSSNRERMLQRVRAYWVEGVLHQAVKEANQFNVGYELTPDAVLKHIDYSDCRLPADTDFGEVFRHLGAEVLILGTPGSGKTILLLQLAEQLLAQAARDDEAPIPIVLNLSSWSHKREALHEWIVNEAAMSYQAPGRAIRRWVEDGAVVPLLDGLDEVLPEYREACVEAINEFHRSYRGVGLGVCSRIGDYDLLQSKLDFRSAILLQPLDEQQVGAVTSRPELEALRITLDKEPSLLEMAHTPYLLNVMSYAYAGKTESELRLPEGESDQSSRRTHLLNSYINRRLAETRSYRTMSAHRMRSLLAWLAFNMTERGQIVFHIESLQMDWLTKFRNRWLYCFLSRVLFAVGGLGPILGAFFLTGGVSSWTYRYFHPQESAENMVAGSFAVAAFGMLLMSVWIFYLAGLCAAAFEWVRSARNATLRSRFAMATFSAVGVGATLGLGIAALGVVPSLTTQEFASGALAAITTFWQLSLLQLIPSTLCMICAWVSHRLKLQSTMPAYAAVGLLAVWGYTLFVYFTSPHSAELTSNLAENAFLIGVPHAMALCMASLFGDQIKTAERIHWRWNTRAATLWAAPWIIFDILGLALVAVPVGLIDADDELVWLPLILFLLGLIPALLSCIFGGLVFGFQRAEGIHRRLAPNEGVFRSIRMGVVLTLGFGAIGFACCMAVAGVFWGLSQTSPFSTAMTEAVPVALALSAFPAGIGAMVGGFDVPVKHFVLRGLLAIGEKIPWRLRRFLDSCASQLMLRRVGGGYIFVHRYLLEHFAQIHRETTRSPKRGR